MTQSKFKPGDTVRVVKLGGPLMVVASCDGVNTTCGWFDKDLHFVTFVFGTRILETARR